MADFDVKLNFDDGGIVASLNKTADLYDKLNKEVKQLDDISKSSSKSIANSLMTANDESKKLLSSVTKTGEGITKGFSKKEIGEVAIAIAKSADQAGKFSELIKKVDDIRMNGVSADINDLEKEFTELIAKVGLTDDQMKVLIADTGGVAEALNSIKSGELETVATKAEVLTKEFASAKAELRALTNSLKDLNGEEFEIAQARAAELTDEIGDIRDAINRAASDTQLLDNIGDAMQLGAAGFQIAEGAAALYGDESEELQKHLLKLNAVMAISNGINDLGRQITEKGTLANKAAAIAQNIWTIAIGKGSLGLKIFRGAVVATGVGALVIAIGYLIANFDAVKAKVLEIFPSLEKIGSVFSGITNSITTFFKNVGNIFDGGASNILSNMKKLGSDVSKAYSDGFDKNEVDKANKKIAESIDQVVASNKKKLDLLKASGNDGAKLQDKILKDELKSLQLSGADKEKILEKEHEINVAAAERSKIATDKRLEILKDFNDKLKSIMDDNQKLRNDAELSNATDPRQRLAIEERLQLEANAKNRDAALEGIKDKAFIAQLNQQYDDQAILLRDAFVSKLIDVLEKETEVEANAAKEKLQSQLERLNQDVAFREKEIDNLIKSGELSVAEIEFWEQQKLQTKINAAKDSLTLLLSAKDIDQKAVKEAQIELAALQTEFGNKVLEIKKNQASASTNAQIKAIDLELQYGEKSERQRAKLEQRKLELILASSKKQLELLENQLSAEGVDLSNYIAEIDAQLKNVENDLSKPFASLKEFFQNTLQDAFGLDGDESQALIEGFTALKSAILDVVNSGYEAELNAIDDSISNREDAISELEGLIEEEYDKKEKGYANDYDALVQQKANEEALLKEDNKKRIDIQKEQLKTETAIQAAQQIGALVTAVANMVASGSKLGIFGLPLIAASVIGLFAMYKNYKNQIKAINSQSAYKGGKVSEYLEIGQTASSDKPGHGKGHRVEGTNLRIGADEFIMNAGTTEKQLPFFRKLNTGAYDNFDFASMLDHIPNTKQLVVMTSKTVEKKEVQKNNAIKMDMITLKEAIKEGVKEQTQLLLEAEYRRPIITNLPDGTVEKVYHNKNGGKKIEIIRP